MSTTRQVSPEELRARILKWETIRLPRLAAQYSPNYNFFCAIVDGLREELRDAEAGSPVIYRGFTPMDVFNKEAGSEPIQEVLLQIGAGLRDGQRLTTGQALGAVKPQRRKSAYA